MGYYLQALISKSPSLRTEMKAFPSEHRIALDQEFTMVVVTEELCDEVADKFPSADNESHKEFSMLTRSLIEWAKELSVSAPIAYVEAEYFGGTGSQSAIVWDQKNTKLGPLSGKIGPINKALQFLGVRTINGKDEFDSIGLNRKRHIDDWIEIAESLN